MRAVGIDPSTKTGVAVVSAEPEGPEVLHSAEVRSPHKGLKRAIDIGEQVRVVLLKYSPDLVVIEGYGFGNAHTLATLVEVGTMIRYKLHSVVPDYTEVAPNALKKFVTGNGNAKKDRMMLEVFKRWSFEGTDNECDAVGLAMFGLAMRGMLTMPKLNMEPVRHLSKA